MKEMHARLRHRHAMGELESRRPDLAFVSVSKDSLRPLLADLRDREGFTHLVLLTAVDWIEDNQFQLTYLLHDRAAPRDLGVRVMLDRDNPVMDSVHDLWPTAATYQRELREMFGIDFPDSPRLDEEFILEGWTDKPPYRRDFDTLEYAEKTFTHRPGRETHDPATYMKQKLYPDGA